MLRNKLKILLCLLTLSLVMTLSACSPKVVTVQKEIIVTTPDSLLVDPCNVIGAGDTVRSLAKGYVVSVSCVREYQLLLEKQRRHKQEMVELYKDGS